MTTAQDSRPEHTTPDDPVSRRQLPTPDELVEQAIVQLDQLAAEMFYLRTRLQKIDPADVVDVIPAAQAGRTIHALAGQARALLDQLERRVRLAG